MFRCQDKGENKIKVNDLLHRVKFLKSSDFGEIGLKLIRLTCAFRKCIDSYTYNVKNWGNQWVKGHSLCGLCGVYGGWPLTHPLTYIRTLYIWQTIPFLNQHSSPINLSPFSMRSDHFENLTPVRKVVDLFPLYSFILTTKHCMDIM